MRGRRPRRDCVGTRYCNINFIEKSGEGQLVLYGEKTAVH